MLRLTVLTLQVQRPELSLSTCLKNASRGLYYWLAQY